MPILGLVLTLAPDTGNRTGALESLTGDPRIILGERCGPRIPLVLEARDPHEVAEFVAAAIDTGEFLKAELCFASYEDSEQEARRGHRA